MSTVLVTGGNTGIGYGTILALLKSTKQQYTVILGSRSLQRGQDAAANLSKETSTTDRVIAIQLDIEDEKSVKNAYAEIDAKFGRLDVLINNAGVSLDSYAEGKTPSMTPKDMWYKTFNINVFSTHFVTQAFVPLLLKSSSPRIIFNSTQIASLETQGTTPWDIDASPPAGWPKSPHGALPAYRSSKAALNMVAKEMAKELKKDGVKVNLVALGKYATAFGGMSVKDQVKMGVPSPEKAGEFVLSFVEGEHDDQQGVFVGVEGVVPW